MRLAAFDVGNEADAAGVFLVAGIEQALGFRRRAFDGVLEALTPDDEAAVLAAQQGYHLSEAPYPGPLAVWMTREDARTVSFSHVLVRPGHVTLRHWLREDREGGREPRQHSLAR